MANATGANVLGNLNGWFKEVYSKAGIENAIPEESLLTRLVPFKGGAERIGNKYHRPVRLKDEQGHTFGDGSGAPALENAIAGQTEDAYIQSNEIAARGRLGYAAMSRAVDTASFGDTTKELIVSLRRSTGKKLEVELLYGGSSIGKVASVASGNVVTLTTAEWAPFIWAGQEGMRVQFFAALTGGSQTADGYVSAVDVANRKVTFTTVTGTIGANNYIFYYGARGLEMTGLHKIASNTGSLFGIDAANYSLWAGNTHALASPYTLSYAEIQKAAMKAVAKGMTGDVTVLVSFATWAKLNSDVAALRSVDYSYDKKNTDLGTEKLTMFYMGGKMTIQASGFVKEGYAYIFKAADFSRIGSRDVSFEIPGRPGQFVLDVQDYMAVEWRCYTDQALFTTKPAHCVVISGIVN